jgi:hypothetical protein
MVSLISHTRIRYIYPTIFPARVSRYAPKSYLRYPPSPPKTETLLARGSQYAPGGSIGQTAYLVICSVRELCYRTIHCPAHCLHTVPYFLLCGIRMQSKAWRRDYRGWEASCLPPSNASHRVYNPCANVSLYYCGFFRPERAETANIDGLRPLTRYMGATRMCRRT